MNKNTCGIKRLNLYTNKNVVPITTVLLVGLAAIISITTISILSTVYWTARTNIAELIHDKGDSLNIQISRKINQFFDPVENYINYLASALEELNEDEISKLDHLLTSAFFTLASLDEIKLSIESKDLLKVYRNNQEVIFDVNKSLKSIDFDDFFSDIQNKKNGTWGSPTWSKKGIYLHYEKNLDRKGKKKIEVTVNAQELSKVLLDLVIYRNQTPFVLYGKNKVLAHPSFFLDTLNFNNRKTEFQFENINNYELHLIWSKNSEDLYPNKLHHNHDDEFFAKIVDNKYVFFFWHKWGYGKKPLIIGSYFPFEDISKQTNRVEIAVFVSAIIFLIALLATYFFGVSVTKPVKKLSSVALSLEKFDFEKIPNMPKSYLKELNDASRIFNKLAMTLKAFGTYVPKSLVLRLIKIGDVRKLKPELKQVTIMFVDIVGFSAMTEKLTAEETTLFLNEFFTLITKSVEKCGGTVDKFIGDEVMAFWGAPEEQPDHFDRAAKAALMIKKNLLNFNRRKDNKNISIRIGIHSGSVIVGNIGTDSRMNYTITGDAVNIAKRIEQFGKNQEPKEVCILLSEETVKGLSSTSLLGDLGEHTIRGHKKKINIFNL